MCCSLLQCVLPFKALQVQLWHIQPARHGWSFHTYERVAVCCSACCNSRPGRHRYRTLSRCVIDVHLTHIIVLQCVAVRVALQGLEGSGVAHSDGASSMFILHISLCCSSLCCRSLNCNTVQFKALKGRVLRIQPVRDRCACHA